MAIFLRQSTEIKVRIGPFLDATDAVTPEVGITLGAADQAEALKADGAATVDISGATWAAITGADGWYDLTLTTSHTDTVGELEIVVQDSSVCLPVFKVFQVLEELVFDSMFAASSVGPIRYGANTLPVSFTAGVTISNASGSALTLTSSGSNGRGLIATGHGTSAGIRAVGGATGAGIIGVGGATSGAGIRGVGTASNSEGIIGIGVGSSAGIRGTGGATGNGIIGVGGATSGAGIRGTGTAGNAPGIYGVGQGSGSGVSGLGGATGHGLLGTGGTNGDGIKGALGGSGVDIRGDITGALSGAVGSVTGAVGSVTGAINTGAGTITTLDGLDTAQDTQHATTQTDISNLNDPTAAAVAGAVWDEAMSGHLTDGTFGIAAQVLDSGTATAGATGTITLDTGMQFTANDEPNDAYIEIVGGTGVGQSRQITDFVFSTRVASVGPDWTTTPSSDSKYIIRGNRRSIIQGFITNAISSDALATSAVDEIVDAVWDEDIVAAHNTADTAGAILNNILPEKNAAFSNIEFLWVAASDHVTPVTGASTTSVTRSIDGGAFGSGTGTLAEVGNGIYQYDASAADMNGTIITFRFVATGGTPGAPDDAFVTIKTSG